MSYKFTFKLLKIDIYFKLEVFLKKRRVISGLLIFQVDIKKWTSYKVDKICHHWATVRYTRDNRDKMKKIFLVVNKDRVTERFVAKK